MKQSSVNHFEEKTFRNKICHIVCSAVRFFFWCVKQILKLQFLVQHTSNLNLRF